MEYLVIILSFFGHIRRNDIKKYIKFFLALQYLTNKICIYEK